MLNTTVSDGAFALRRSHSAATGELKLTTPPPHSATTK